MSIEKAVIKDLDNNNALHKVMYNPPSLQITSSNSYAETKTPGGKPEGGLQFIKNNSDILSVDLFFDSTHENGSVMPYIWPILNLAKVPSGKKQPPKVMFVWGDWDFEGVIISIDQTYDYFNSSGQAMRATLKIKIRSSLPEGEAEAPKPAAKKPVVKQVIQAGQNITCFCENPKDWQSVATTNNLDNPNLVSSGAMIGEELVCKEPVNYSSM